MTIVDSFLVWWLKNGRYPWSRLVRNFSKFGNTDISLPKAKSLADVELFLKQITWTMDSALHLYDSISLPEVVWKTKRDDCDGYAVLASALLKNLNPSTNPKLVTVILRPVRESHTICVFSDQDQLRFFDNSRLNSGSYQTYHEIPTIILRERQAERIVCWDVADPENLLTLEFHKGD